MYSLRSKALSESYKVVALAVVMEAIAIPRIEKYMDCLCVHYNWNMAYGKMATIVVQLLFVIIAFYCILKCVSGNEYFKMWQSLKKDRDAMTYTRDEIFDHIWEK
ncbi:hypothetical protein [Bartonella sp. cb54]|uniref:hypothetical protein n=1 Tax=Bartonella sp. cb54 TaxID=3385560 RepID=UPI0039A60420